MKADWIWRRLCKKARGLPELAKNSDILYWPLAGSVTKDAIECNKNGIDAFFPILHGISTLEEARKPENVKLLDRQPEQGIFAFSIFAAKA